MSKIITQLNYEKQKDFFADISYTLKRLSVQHATVLRY